MKPETKMNKVPQNAVSFYSKLYCKRKGSTKTKSVAKIVEASKSWLTLSEEEKHIFHSKFKDCKTKFTKKIIDCLEKAEPFMKEKKPKQTRIADDTDSADNNNESIENEIQPQLNESEDDDQLQIHSHENEKSNVIDQEICSADVNDTLNSEQITEEQNTVDLQQGTGNSFCEPAPPIVKSGKELFEMLQSIGQKNDSTWMSLPKVEKSRYNCAILTLKKDYIHKYSVYLDSLSSRELFNHYNKLYL